jgi:hypothetical protein
VDQLAQGLDRDTRERLLAELDGLSEADVAQRLTRGMAKEKKENEDVHA